MMLMYVDVFFDVDDVEQFILILMKAVFFWLQEWHQSHRTLSVADGPR